MHFTIIIYIILSYDIEYLDFRKIDYFLNLFTKTPLWLLNNPNVNLVRKWRIVHC